MNIIIYILLFCIVLYYIKLYWYMYYTQTWMNVGWVQRDVNTSVRTLTEDLNVDVQKVNFYMSMADPVSVSDDDSEFCLWVVKTAKSYIK